GVATEMAVGLAMAQQMVQQGLTSGPPSPAGIGPGAAAVKSAPAGGGGLPELLSPSDVAKALGVTDADVMTILESGELAGKKIGAAWRIKRSALDEYLAK